MLPVNGQIDYARASTELWRLSVIVSNTAQGRTIGPTFKMPDATARGERVRPVSFAHPAINGRTVSVGALSCERAPTARVCGVSWRTPVSQVTPPIHMP